MGPVLDERQKRRRRRAAGRCGTAQHRAGKESEQTDKDRTRPKTERDGTRRESRKPAAVQDTVVQPGPLLQADQQTSRAPSERSRALGARPVLASPPSYTNASRQRGGGALSRTGWCHGCVDRDRGGGGEKRSRMACWSVLDQQTLLFVVSLLPSCLLSTCLLVTYHYMFVFLFAVMQSVCLGIRYAVRSMHRLLYFVHYHCVTHLHRPCRQAFSPVQPATPPPHSCTASQPHATAPVPARSTPPPPHYARAPRCPRTSAAGSCVRAVRCRGRV